MTVSDAAYKIRRHLEPERYELRYADGGIVHRKGRWACVQYRSGKVFNPIFDRVVDGTDLTILAIEAVYGVHVYARYMHSAKGPYGEVLIEPATDTEV